MKSSRKKRILATILCMVMVLTSNISALAEGDGLPDMTEQGVTAASVPETPEQEPEVPGGQTQQTSVDSSATVQTTPEVTPETTPVTTPEVTPTTTPETTPGATTTNETPGSDTPANSHTAAGTGKGVTGGDDTTTTVTTPETTVPTPEVTPEETGDVFSEATELTQEFKDAQGRVVQKVTAKLPAGAFAAETSHITMEVQYLDEASENHIKNLMTKQLPQGDELGDYIALSVKFKVDGVETEALQPITITFEKSGLEIKDVKKANVFYYDPADPTVAGDQDELVEITQRSELLESLQAAGQSTDNIEDYDLSSIEIKEENRSEKIQFEGRKSTIYGCYVEKTPEEVPVDIPVLNYEDDKVTVSVTAEEAGIIPEGAELKVVPITSEDTDTKEQYKEVEKKIQEKVAEEEKEVAGFLAYDITFVDKDGNEMEPNGKVKVSMNYKKAELPPEVVEKKATDAEVTVLHLEEDENGEVKQVVDMGAEQKANVDTLTTTEGAKVQNVEVETESFSVFTITWKYGDVWKDVFTIKVHYVDKDGVKINVNDAPAELKLSSNKTVGLEKYWRDAVKTDYVPYEIRANDINGDSITSLKTYGGYIYEVKYLKKDNRYYTDWLSSSGKKLGDIYFVYENDSSSGGEITGGGSSATGSLGHSKYVEDNKDGTYDLTLDVVGAVGTETNPAAVDIVFVLDLSNSMKGDNISKAKNAVKTLTDDIGENVTIDPKWKLVTFGSSAEIITHSWTSTFVINAIIQGYTDEDCDRGQNGGTNYQAGLTQAGNVLKTARRDSEKIVIFLTDGQPTYHGVNEKGGYNRTNKADYEGALLGAETITCNRFYAVGMGLPDQITIYNDENDENDKTYKTTTGIGLLTDVAEKAKTSAYQAINVGKGESLDNIFSNISGSITEYTATNVTITDRLTAEVDLVDSAGEVTDSPENFKIKVLNKEKEDVTRQEVNEGSIVASYNSGIKEIKLDFADDYELKEGYTYSVTAKIKPNDQAKRRYEENDYSYPDTGEKGTGITSDGKKGIFSNVNDSAKVTWTTNGEKKEGTYNRPVVQIQENEIPVRLKKEPVNFFLNLTSSILDTNGQIGSQLESAFTTSVSGSFSGRTNNPQGIGVPINADLMVVVPDAHDHAAVTGGNKVYGVIGGTSDTNAKLVDEKIRELGKEEGTNGNQTGTEDEYYRIVNGSDQAAFPTDEEIFEYIKEYWGTNGVNKGKNITINGNPINKDNLTTKNFAIRWYVFKDQANEEYWHIDGILVPKSGVLTITKTFPNQEVADAVKDTFKIKVTGDFLGTTDNTTITKGLSEAGKPTINADKTVTYKWELAVFGEKYNVEETGYETASNSKWKYLSTQWTYTNASGQMSEGTTTSCEVKTERTAEDETPKKQTLALTNTYELANISIDLMKFGTTYDNPLAGARFELYRGSKDYPTLDWEKTPQQFIDVVNENSIKELDLPEGYYKLKEVLAPTGYQLLGKDICFKIENRVVTLIDAAGDTLEYGNTEMWKLEGDNTNGFVLKIKNEALYALPSTGGPGIFVYTIGGTLLLMAAALLIYKMKREEVLKG